MNCLLYINLLIVSIKISNVIFLDKLSRDKVWTALKTRHTSASSGDPIEAMLFVNGKEGGEIAPKHNGKIEIDAYVAGYDKLEKDEVIQNGKVITASYMTDIMEKKGRCIAVQSPADVQLDCNDKTIVQPDVFVICDREKILRHCLYGAPDLVVEILSKATRKKDMGIKQAKYMNAGVREYWIVDPDARKIVVYDLEQEKLPVIYGFGDSVPVRIFQGECVIDFAQIYGYIRFLYEK